MRNAQKGPDGSADLLERIVGEVSYKPGWKFELRDMYRHGEHLGGGEGLTLSIRLEQEDSTKPGETVGLHHLFAVPPAAYCRETWERWILDCIIQVETHEATEFFKVNGYAPYFPEHGFANGYSPYEIRRRSRPRNSSAFWEAVWG